ncbi:hypothetical protein EDD21DRAFT_130277 [Dissophora ornata]|nr:hypothetical protein EDD21DRAFT_130277 [Dissophora ornata]
MTVSEITRQYSLLKEKVSNQEQAARRRTESRELMEHQDTEQQQQQQQLSRTRRPLSVATSTPSTEFRRYSPVSATMSSPTTNDSYQPISPAMSPVRAMVQVPLREDGNREVKVPDNNVNNQHQTSEERRQSNDTATTRRYIESSHRMSQPPFSKSHTIEQHHRHQRQYQQQHQQQQYHQQHQPQQRQYLAPPQTSSRPTTTDSVPKYPQNDRQHLLRPPMSSLPPSPISPQTSWKTSEANPLKVAVTAAKRARDGNGVDALALRPMKPIPMPTSLPPSLPLPRPPPPPPQSVPGPSSSSSSATAPHHQSILASMRNHNPRPIPAPVHQAIYDSLLKAQGGPAKRIRVDYRRPGEKDDVEADSGIVAGADTYAAKGAAGKAPMENQYRHEEHSRQFQSQHQQQQYQQKPQQHHSHQHPYQHPRQQQQTMPYQSRDWHSDDKAPPGERRPLMQERVLDERSKGKRGLELEQRRRVERERMAYEMSLEADRSRKEREESERKRWQAEELDVKMQGKKEEIEGMRQLEEEERRVEFQMEMLQKEQQRLQFLKQMKRQQRPPSTEQCPQETTSTWKSHHRQGSEGTVKYEADRSPRPLTGAPHFQHRFPPQPSGEYRDHQWKTQQNAANPARVAEGQGRPAGHEEMQREHDPEASRRQEEPRLQQLSFQHRSDSHAHPQR